MSTTDTTYAREISYDRSSRDYAMYLDGELVGYARTYHEAEITLDELVFELLSQTASHPGPDCSCPDCTRAAERLIIDAFMTRLRFDAGVLCSFCGDDHADSECPLRRSLLIPRVCGNCQGQHSIQACDEIRAALFAA